MVAAVAQHLAYLPRRARRFLQPRRTVMGCCRRPPRVMADGEFQDLCEVVQVKRGAAQHPLECARGTEGFAIDGGRKEAQQFCDLRCDVGEGGGRHHRCLPLSSRWLTCRASMQRKPCTSSRFSKWRSV